MPTAIVKKPKTVKIPDGKAPARLPSNFLKGTGFVPTLGNGSKSPKVDAMFNKAGGGMSRKKKK